jgi:LPXTG-motif cell wall-anchored protein
MPAAPGTPPGSNLAATGVGEAVPLALAGAAVLTALGAALLVATRRRRAQQG